MTLDDILLQWTEDSEINPTKLDNESVNIPKLHSKYWKILTSERMMLRRYENDYKKLSLDKFQFLTEGPTKETVAKGWELPSRGRLIKAEVDKYLEGDNDLLNLSLKVSLQKEKVTVLDDIVRSINNRNWVIKNIIDYYRFQAGN